LAAPMESIIPKITENVPFLLSTNSSIFMQVRRTRIDHGCEPLSHTLVMLQNARPSLMCTVWVCRRCWRTWRTWMKGRC
jgi:hypothetical protein